ncbi:tripartite tricarboxylate transporter substrate binding protein [Falsiroseomonas sp.]|uniref:Bug family tripartite tricarboxylate transporter substrate binding protein n=1 Tax=Falsiroseomonas sp. TaxID=2870721 RepID=UPI002736C755|nr:tripartite tricarboxylate transporter substrate-binding protein [Falsiroseomonas sp.]MDP3415481.1 tripartite tricarboxylate transporter substrate-binding protein [Falsiroseomonas sp.]
MTATLTRRGLGAATFGLLPAAAAAQPAAYPGTRPVSIVVSFAPGGSTDTVARIVAQQLQRILGGSFVVENRPGASGTIGSGHVARARPDGYTLLFAGSGTYSMSGHLYPQRGYDEETNFTPIGSVSTSSLFMCLSPKHPMRDIGAFIARAKAEPGKLSYASSGAGSSAHMITELFLEGAGIQVENITYRGGAPAMQALITGEVQMAFVEAVTALPQMRNGDIIGVAVTSAQRSPLAPDVPTIAEAAVPGFEGTTLLAMFAPAGTPDEIIQRLHRGVAEAMQVPEVMATLRTGAVFPRVMTPEEFRPFLTSERRRWLAVIRSRGISAQ